MKDSQLDISKEIRDHIESQPKDTKAMIIKMKEENRMKQELMNMIAKKGTKKSQTYLMGRMIHNL